MRQKASAVLAALLLTFALSSCGPAGDPGPFVVIGHMEHRDRIVTIKTGALGPVYSAKTRDGKVLFENLTAAQLKVQSPEIHDLIDAAEAGTAVLGPSAKPRVIPDLVR